RLAVPRLRRFLPVRKIHVCAPRREFARFHAALGSDVVLLDEDEVVPGLRLAELRKLKLPGFPRGAGWYFQQLLKCGFAFLGAPEDSYLIWDADTVPLRKIELFDESGRTYFTRADEHHAPYFENYERLLGRAAAPPCSFIAQHIVVQKTHMRAMLSEIEGRISGAENWAWKIMRTLSGPHSNLFSEYEFYGNYVYSAHPEEVVLRDLSWTRDGVQLASFHPTDADLDRLAKRFDFVSFESGRVPWRKAVRWIKARLACNG
ncbi:MAG TPA: DUF6492 family protein, partial [Chthoniobacteraceae bacterium]